MAEGAPAQTSLSLSASCGVLAVIIIIVIIILRPQQTGVGEHDDNQTCVMFVQLLIVAAGCLGWNASWVNTAKGVLFLPW